jgi:glycosyltransferase involved in cell wall biosynthesis
MVQTLLGGLPAHGIDVHHVNLSLSRNAADIGRWRPGKIGWTLVCSLRAVMGRLRFGCDTLYYVPAPPEKRGALYRDWMILLLSRPFFRHTVLHWHAAGLGEWLSKEASLIERVITRVALGRVDLAIVLANSLRSDGEKLRARRIAVVPNGIADPGPLAPAAPSRTPYRVLYLGMCSKAKGLFAAVAAVIEANRRECGPEQQPVFVLTVAGPFADETTAARFHTLAAEHPRAMRYAGIVSADEKRRLFEASHCVCMPTRYSAEAQPLVLLEALAHDRPIVATRWRGIPEIMSRDTGILVSPDDDAGLVDALLHLRNQPSVVGACRTRFLELYSADRHLAALATALRTLE